MDVSCNKITLAVERHYDTDWLIADDGCGNIQRLAIFMPNCAQTFNAALTLAKAAPHAAGASGP
jgi:hypothetical protein